MSDVFSEVEAAVVAMLRAAPALAEVKTIEADVRECLFSGDKLTQGFRPEEMPAINVSAELEPGKRGPFTVGEIEVVIPVSAIAIARAQRKRDARAKAREIQAAIEGILDQARRSANGLGANAIVTGEISSTVVIVEEKPHHFAIAETKCQVRKVVQL